MRESYTEQITDLVIHKNLFMQSALKMYNYLCSQGRQVLGLKLMRRAMVHDNSKMDRIELRNLSKFGDSEGDGSSMGNAEKTLSKQQMALIKRHWKNNPHHPEYYKDYSKMTELDIVEMVCDWHARSVQFGNDLIEFVKTRQENRFHFENKQFKKIMRYCEVLVQ